MSARKRGLGRGLDALLATQSTQVASTESNTDSVVSDTKSGLTKLPIEQLHPGKYQPRKDMSPEALDELASSIKTQGIIQPIVEIGRAHV